MRKNFAVGVVAAMVVAILPVATSSVSFGAVKASNATSIKDFGGMNGLVTACKKEGKLNVITLPRDWANYGEAMDLFSKAFGVKIFDDNPDGSSAYEVQPSRPLLHLSNQT